MAFWLLLFSHKLSEKFDRWKWKKEYSLRLALRQWGFSSVIARVSRKIHGKFPPLRLKKKKSEFYMNVFWKGKGCSHGRKGREANLLAPMKLRSKEVLNVLWPPCEELLDTGVPLFSLDTCCHQQLMEKEMIFPSSVSKVLLESPTSALKYSLHSALWSCQKHWGRGHLLLWWALRAFPFQ